MSKQVEVESGELAVMSSKGAMAIIPKDKVEWVKSKIDEKCWNCLDHYISTLPNIGNKAEHGKQY